MVSIVGYARVSTPEQKLESQTVALKQAGCEKIFEDTYSGTKKERPGLVAALQYLREGDTFVVWKIDRLGRTLANLLEILETLKRQRVRFLSLTESIDTSTSMGMIMYTMIGMFAEFERNQMSERMLLMSESARASGKKVGRRAIIDKEKEPLFRELYMNRAISCSAIGKTFGMSKSGVLATARRLGLRGRVDVR